MNICVFGDSITWGDHDLEKGGWVERLKTTMMEDYHHVYNLGISGDTTNNLLERFASEVSTREVDVIVFAIGINDTSSFTDTGEPQIPLNQFRLNMERLLTLAEPMAKKILVLGLTRVDETKTRPVEWDSSVFYQNKRIKEYDDTLLAIAVASHAEYISLEDVFDAADYPDGLHPDMNGHEKIFRKMDSVVIRVK